MFRPCHEPLESKPKIPRKAENKVSKRSWRPGPAPAKPDTEVSAQNGILQRTNLILKLDENGPFM